MRRSGPYRLAVVVLLLVVTGCFGGGGGTPGINQPASEITAPPALDVERTGLSGVVLATNSPSFRRLVDAPEGAGAVILFVEPGGPTDGLGVGRGDLITEVEGEEVSNHSRALALLHGLPDEELEVSIRHRDGRERTITIRPRVPRVASLRQFINPLVAASPNDPILRFLRAQTPGVLTERLRDLEAALEADDRFVEAMSLQASLTWDFRPQDPVEQRRFVAAALEGWQNALEIDPDNTFVLTARSPVLSVIGNAQQGLRDANNAVELDEGHPRAYYAVAVAEESLRRPQRAAAPARLAVDLDPFNIQHWRVLARIFAALDRKADCEKTTGGFAPFLEQQNLNQDARTLRSLCEDSE